MGVHQPLHVLESIVAEIEYPMLVATTTSKGQNCGCLVGFATPCSMDPFTYIAFISRETRTFDVAHDADVLALHFLSADEESLASILGKLTGDAVDKFALCDWQKGPDGVPILADAQRWIAGPIVERITGATTTALSLSHSMRAPGHGSGSLEVRLPDALRWDTAREDDCSREVIV